MTVSMWVLSKYIHLRAKCQVEATSEGKPMNSPKIVVLDGDTLNPGDNPWTPIENLGHLTVYPFSQPKEVLNRAEDADVLLTNKTKIDGPLLTQLPHLKLVSVLATGTDIVDKEAAKTANVTVTNVPEYGTNSVAQFTIALILELTHRIGLHNSLVASGEWSKRGRFSFWDTNQSLLESKTAVIVGHGLIARKVATHLEHFGMTVLHADSRPREQWQTQSNRHQLNDVLPQADIITLHCPLTPANRHMINSETLALLKPGAMIINTARGPLIDETALSRALSNGQLSGAALDVLTQEPPPPTNPL